MFYRIYEVAFTTIFQTIVKEIILRNARFSAYARHLWPGYGLKIRRRKQCEHSFWKFKSPMRVIVQICVMCICLAFFLVGQCQAFPMDFTTFRLGDGTRAVLVVGGIQGDEPGGFSAATLLATRYEILSGAMWVVPNLNFPSIIKRSRGVYGDMNRKFAVLDKNDPEFDTVRRIQDLINHPRVGLVLNLHDGSGFYRQSYQDKLRNPARWGQSIIIDQEGMAENVFMGALGREAENVAALVNKSLVDENHAIHVRNTNTAAGDHEMEKSLSYYAVRRGKAAFGIEASKEIPVALRAYYHLRIVESFLKLAGVEFHRDFELSPAGVAKALQENLDVSFAGNRVFLPLEDARATINYLPLPRDCIASAITSKPIMAVLPCGKNDERLCVHYGNRTIAHIMPEWRELDNDLDAVHVLVDGIEKLAPFGHTLDVEREALVREIAGYRVNAIGLDKGLRDETNIPLRRKDFEPRFSVDKAGSIFRVEVYKGKSLAGIFLLRFKNPAPQVATKNGNLPAVPGPESGLGY